MTDYNKEFNIDLKKIKQEVNQIKREVSAEKIEVELSTITTLNKLSK